MTERKKLTHPDQIPELESDEEKVKFWKEVELTKEFFSHLEPVPEEELPTIRKGDS